MFHSKKQYRRTKSEYQDTLSRLNRFEAIDINPNRHRIRATVALEIKFSGVWRKFAE